MQDRKVQQELASPLLREHKEEELKPENVLKNLETIIQEVTESLKQVNARARGQVGFFESMFSGLYPSRETMLSSTIKKTIEDPKQIQTLKDSITNFEKLRPLLKDEEKEKIRDLLGKLESMSRFVSDIVDSKDYSSNIKDRFTKITKAIIVQCQSVEGQKTSEITIERKF